jgi:hypothetical protein
VLRPQFPFETPDGFEDCDFEYYFDNSNTPALNTSTLAVGQQINGIPLPLQQDAPFYCRAIVIDNPTAALGVRFRDSAGNYLSDDFIPVGLVSGMPPGQHPPVGPLVVILEPEAPFPKGGVIYVDVKRLA